MVLVVWDDAHCTTDMGDQQSLDEEHSPKLTYSIGFQIRKDRNGVTIAQDCYEKGKEYRVYSFIPKGMVVSCTKLLGT